jgi:hypothetical protein
MQTSFFFRPTICFLLQGIQSNFIDTESTEIGNADVAANVLGCAAKVLPLPPFRMLYSPDLVRIASIFHVSVRLIATRLALYQFEEGLRNVADPGGLHQRAKIQAMLMYYSCRMEAVGLFFFERLIPNSRPVGHRAHDWFYKGVERGQ